MFQFDASSDFDFEKIVGEYPSSVKEVIYDHHNENETYCIVVIRLKEKHESQFTKDVHIPLELANIYHFYLHPDHIPNAVINLPHLQNKYASNKSLDGFRFPINNPNKKFESSVNPHSKVLIDYSVKEITDANKKQRIDLNSQSSTNLSSNYSESTKHHFILNDLNSSINNLIAKAKAVYKFELTIPNSEISNNIHVCVLIRL